MPIREEQQIAEMESSMSSLKMLLKGAGFFFMGMIFSKAIFYIFRLIVARQGYAEYGTFSIAVSVFDILSLFAFVGVTTALLKFIPEEAAKGNQKRINDLIFSSFRISFVASSLICIFLIAFAGTIATEIFKNPSLTPVLMVMALAIPFYTLGGIATTILRAFGKMKYEVIIKSYIENIVKLGLAVLLLGMGLGIVGVAFAYLISIVGSFLLALSAMEFKVHKFFRLKVKFIGDEMRLLRFSFPLMLSGTVYLLIAWADVILLGALKNSSDVGVYSSALPTAALLLLLPTALNSLFLPIITGILTKNRKNDFKTTYGALSKWVFFGNFGIFIIFMFFGRQVLRLLFGQAYEIGSDALQILALGHLIYSVLFNASDVLSALGKTRQIFNNTIIAAIANILLNFTLIPIYGIIGAAIATSCSIVLLSSLNTYHVYKLTGNLPFSKSFYKPVISGVLAMIAISGGLRAFALQANSIILVIACGLYFLTYGGILLLMRGFDSTDFGLIAAVLRKLGIDSPLIKGLVRQHYSKKQ